VNANERAYFERYPERAPERHDLPVPGVLYAEVEAMAKMRRRSRRYRNAEDTRMRERQVVYGVWL
jgi:hypothetical protein